VADKEPQTVAFSRWLEGEFERDARIARNVGQRAFTSAEGLEVANNVGNPFAALAAALEN